MRVFSGAKLGAKEIGIGSCAAASVVPECAPRSLPGIPKEARGRKNTFYTASEQKIPDSGFKVISGKASCCASRLNLTLDLVLLQFTVC